MQDLKAEAKGEIIRSNQNDTQKASFYFSLAGIFMRLLACLPSSVSNNSNIYFQQKIILIVYLKSIIGINQEWGGVTTVSQII